MEKFVNWIWEAWQWKLLVIFMPIGGGTILRWLWVKYRDARRRFPSVSTRDAPDPTSEVISLRPRHTRSPKTFGFLKGCTVKVNGFPSFKKFNDDSSSIVQVRPYPFGIDADVICEFPPEDARTIHKLNGIELASVVGQSQRGFEIGSEHEGYKHKLLLTNCTVGPPTFVTVPQNTRPQRPPSRRRL